MDLPAKRIVADRLQTVNQDIQILRDTDPRCADLEALGYALVGESWGARLRLDENEGLSLYSDAVNRVLESGIDIQELGVEWADALLELELINNPDYPYTPATSRAVPTEESIRALWRLENRLFGAISAGVLVGAISTSGEAGIVELDFASILREYRGMGIGKALVSAAILSWIGTGIRIFATGGAMTNEASLGTVESLGFNVEERWRSYQLPM